jgi:hypothetical protein
MSCQSCSLSLVLTRPKAVSVPPEGMMTAMSPVSRPSPTTLTTPQNHSLGIVSSIMLGSISPHRPFAPPALVPIWPETRCCGKLRPGTPCAVANPAARHYKSVRFLPWGALPF